MPRAQRATNRVWLHASVAARVADSAAPRRAQPGAARVPRQTRRSGGHHRAPRSWSRGPRRRNHGGTHTADDSRRPPTRAPCCGRTGKQDVRDPGRCSIAVNGAPASRPPKQYARPRARAACLLTDSLRAEAGRFSSCGRHLACGPMVEPHSILIEFSTDIHILGGGRRPLMSISVSGFDADTTLRGQRSLNRLSRAAARARGRCSGP